jgi:hypothetical protein
VPPPLERPKRRRVETARQLVLEWLAAHSCSDCGENDRIVLEFDHVGDKRSEISTLVLRGVRVAEIEREIARCEVVCANCHRRRTAKRAGWRRLHAGLAGAPWRSAREERNVRHAITVLHESGCVDCGASDICALDFDHVGPKRASVMRLARDEASLARLDEEIACCEVRCANCHRRRTAVTAGYFRARGGEVPPARIELALTP